MTTRQALHELVDGLPEDVLLDVERYLREVAPASDARPPLTNQEFLKLLKDAPEDDEPLSDEDIAAINAAKEHLRNGGRAYSQDEVERLLAEL